MPNSVPASTGTRTTTIATNSIETVTTPRVSVPSFKTVPEPPALPDSDELLNNQADVRKFIIYDGEWRASRYFSPNQKGGLSNSWSVLRTVAVRENTQFI